MLWLMLTLTILLTVWAIARDRRTVLAGRYLRHAGMPTATSVAPVRSGLALPRPLAEFMERTGVGWTPLQTILVFAGAGLGGYLLALRMGLAPLGLLAGVGVVLVYLQVQTRKRIRTLAEQLPDTLMLMASALKGGLGFQQAIQMVAKEGPAPLAGVLDNLGQELAMGMSLAEALERFKLRMESTDGEMLASALLVQRQTGGNLSEILLNLHGTMRDRQAVHGQVRALTAQGRLSGVILVAMPFAMAGIINVIDHAYLGILFTDPRGRLALMVSGVMILIGGLIIRRIVNITL